ncbi:MAG: helix-turn-helix domain-containing protein [Vicinamibacterales bacterium]
MADERTDIGLRLRQAREQRDISLRQIADDTKLSVRALDALERGDIKSLPGGIYRRAIVRAYAEHVGLSPEDAVRQFLAQYPDEPTPFTITDEPAPAPRRFSLHALLQIMGALVPVVAGVAYFSMAPVDTRRAAPPDVFAPRGVDEWRPEIVPAGGFAEAPPPAARPVALMLTVSSRCELRVVIDGREVIARQLEAGEQLQLDLTDEVVLSGDNAGAVQFSINGQAGRLLGEAGEPLQVRIARDDYETWLVRD